MRLECGALFPLPIVLDVDKAFFQSIQLIDQIILRDKEGFQIAKMLVESIWKPDFEKEADLIFGTSDRLHPGVNYLFQHRSPAEPGAPSDLHPPQTGMCACRPRLESALRSESSYRQKIEHP